MTERTAARKSSALVSNIDDFINATCTWSGKPWQDDSLTFCDGDFVGFCNPGFRDQFESAELHIEEVREEKRRFA